MPDVPNDLSELVARWDEIHADLVFLRQLKKLQILTNGGTVTVEVNPGGENAVLDIRETLDASITRLLP